MNVSVIKIVGQNLAYLVCDFNDNQRNDSIFGKVMNFKMCFKPKTNSKFVENAIFKKHTYH